MRLQTLAITAVSALTLCFTGCKSESALPPNPTSIINHARDQLTPFRFNLTTEPTSPKFDGPIMLKVHVLDAANQPAEGVTLNANVSMSGMQQSGHQVTLSDKGNGDYEASMNLEMAGSWDVNLTATKDDKSRQQKLRIDVGG